MNRITERDLEAQVLRINSAFGLGNEPWERVDGKLQQVPGVYHLSGAYGGVSLHRNCDVDASGESHGVHDVFGIGHVPKRELHGRMRSFLEGVTAARA